MVMMVGLALEGTPVVLARGLGAMGGGRGLDRMEDLGRPGGELDSSSLFSALFSPLGTDIDIHNCNFIPSSL